MLVVASAALGGIELDLVGHLPDWGSEVKTSGRWQFIHSGAECDIVSKELQNG